MKDTNLQHDLYTDVPVEPNEQLVQWFDSNHTPDYRDYTVPLAKRMSEDLNVSVIPYKRCISIISYNGQDIAKAMNYLYELSIPFDLKICSKSRFTLNLKL